MSDHGVENQGLGFPKGSSELEEWFEISVQFIQFFPLLSPALLIGSVTSRTWKVKGVKRVEPIRSADVLVRPSLQFFTHRLK